MNNLSIKIRNIFLFFFALVFSPLFYFLIWARKRKIRDEGKLRILVIPQLTRIGDIVCSTPVFRAVKIAYPNSHLAVLVSKKAAGIIKNNSRIDELITYEDYNFLGLMGKIRRNYFNWSICLSGTSLATLLVFLGLVPRRVKLTRDERPISEILTDWLANFKLRYKHHTYAAGFYLKLLEFIGIKNPEEIKEVFVSSRGEKKAEEFLRQNNISQNHLLIGISLTAGNKVKEWGDDNFKELAKQLVEKYNAKIIFLGAKSDEERIDKAIFDLDKNNFLKAIDFSLEDLPSLIKRLKLLIAVDTGPIYIAHALKIPLIDIIGPVDPTEQPPEDEASVLVRPPAHIKPSSFVFKKPGSVKERKVAAQTIKISDVLNAAQKLLIKK